MTSFYAIQKLSTADFELCLEARSYSKRLRLNAISAIDGHRLTCDHARFRTAQKLDHVRHIVHFGETSCWGPHFREIQQLPSVWKLSERPRVDYTGGDHIRRDAIGTELHGSCRMTDSNAALLDPTTAY